MTDIHENVSPDTGEGFEQSDVNIGKILGITIASLVLLIVFIIILSQYFTSYKEHRIYESVLRPESALLRDLHAREDKVLNSYDVIDRAQGVYRIPINRAMELEAEEAYENRQK